MANIAEGLRKSVFYKKETTFGELAGNTGGRTLRRVTSNFNLSKETYQSEEIRTDLQMADFRHGVRSVEGSLSAELSPRSYADFFASAVARNWTTGVSVTGLSLTIAAVTGGYTLTRASGSFLTSGIKIGDVIRLSGAGLNTANVAKNLLVTAETALVLTVVVLNGSAMVAEGPIATVTAAVVGSKTFAPLSGHTSDSYTFEEYYNDITQSEVYTGNKINTIGMSLPATGLTTVDFGFMGQDLKQSGTSQYFTSPTGQGTDGIFAAVNGALLVGGEVVALVTGLTVNLNRDLSMEPVVGSNFHPEIFDGRILVDGEFTAFFTGGTFRTLFNDEVETSLVVALTTSNQKDADFMSIVLPRIKVNSDTKDDGEKGIVSTHSFQALLNFNGGTGTATEATTISFQDSTLV
jgi:Phage tail tube protein